MANLKQILKKQGGFGLIKQYWHSGALFTAVNQFLVLGKSRTALELLRLSAQLKGKKKLQKKYLTELEKFDAAYDETLSHMQSNKVWVCWFQGMDAAPELVQRCFHSLKDNLNDREIILITEDNMADYVQFPQYILDKWKDGIITHTHMTDLLRLELLIRYGGMWIDSTVLCTRERQEIPDYYFDSDLFFYQCLKPGRDGHSHVCSSWLMSAASNNKLLMAVRHLCYSYWKTHNKMVDYFLLHDFIAICLEYYPEAWNAIVPSSNSTPHILLLRLFEPYDEAMWKAICDQTPFHKLSYKFTEEQRRMAGTYYEQIINH